MKKLLSFSLAFFAAVASFAQNPCNCEVLEGNQTVNKTLVSTKCYLLKGCYTVKAPARLGIQAGTKIFGDKDSKGSLIIERGAQINAQGQEALPIIFTSNQPVGSRQPGDWGGIIIAGKAPNNQPGGEFTVEGPCTPITAGGTDPNDNSGTLRFARIEYAGIAFSANNEINSLTLASVGRGTKIDHIFVSYANDDAFEWFGGTVNTKYLVAYKTRDDDFDTDFGYSGLNQFGLAIRDNNYHDVSGSNGFESDNNATGTTDLPQTQAIFSNFTVMGPLSCNGTAHAEFRNGAQIRRNSSISIFNTVIAGWPTGLLLDGQLTVNNANVNNTLNFAHNILAGNTTPLALGGGATWPAGCSSTLANWFKGFGAPACKEIGNETFPGIASLGYRKTCTNGCADAPVFRIKPSSTLDSGGSFTEPQLLDPFFEVVSYRGAMYLTDWTKNAWGNFCADTTHYCPAPSNFRTSGVEEVESTLGAVAVPNPTVDATVVSFILAEGAQVEVAAFNGNGEKVADLANGFMSEGENSVAFSTANLNSGLYFVKIKAGKKYQTVKVSVTK